MPDSGEWRLAVDFGTSNTTAMILVDGVSRPVVFDQGAVSMPSNVLRLDDGFRTGRTAQNQWRLAPDRYERAPKRRVGRGEVWLGNQPFPPAELVGAVLAVVVERARVLVGGRRLAAVALSHPQEWSPGQRADLVDAAGRAGLGHIEPVLVSEPVAAALRYEAADLAAGIDRALVFDFGGGTCDVTLLGRGGTGRAVDDVIVTVGDTALGGIDFDQRLTAWVLDRMTERGLGAAVERLRSPAGLGARLSLLGQVQLAKEALSENASAAVPITVGDVDTVVQITRGEYEALIEPDVRRAAALVTQAMQRGGVASGSLERVYLTGGSAQTPVVVDAVRTVTGVAPAPFEDVKLVVAEGALLMLERAAGGRRPEVPPLPTRAPAPSPTPAPTPTSEETPTPTPTPEVSFTPREGRTPAPSRTPIPTPEAGSSQTSVPSQTSEPAREPVPVGTAVPVHDPDPTPGRHRTVLIASLVTASVAVLILVGVLAVPPMLSAFAKPGGGGAGGSGTTAAAKTITCWDGSKTTDTCPALTGADAIHWVFPTADGHDFSKCEQTVPDLDSAVGSIKTELRCTWKDLPHTTVYLYEFADHAKGQQYQQTSAKLDMANPTENRFTVSNEELGDEWTGTGNDRHTGSVSAAADVDEQMLLYDSIPFGYRIVTDTTAGGTHEQQKQADDGWLTFREKKDVDAMLKTLKK